MHDIQFHNAGSAFFMVGFALFAVIGSGLLMTGLLTLIQSIAPNVMGRSTTAIRHHPILAPVIGAGVFIALAALSKVKVPALQAIVLLDFIVFALFGLAATSEDVGRRITWLAGREGNRVSHLATGWAVFFTASCIPFLGWFVIFPFGVFTGIGSLLLGLGKKTETGVPTSLPPGVDMEIR